MALYDDKRFILSHIRHSFITCDDTGASESVMLTENALARFPPGALYHTPFDYDSDEEFVYGVADRYQWEEEYGKEEDEDLVADDEDDAEEEDGASIDDKEEETKAATNEKGDLAKQNKAAANLITQDDLDFFKVTEVDYKSDLLDDHFPANNNNNNSYDIMSESFEVGMRRRSNTHQRLEKLKKERKYQAKTRVVTWKSPTKVVTVLDPKLGRPVEKRLVVHPTALPPEEIAMLEFDEKEGVYYETEEYRKFLFPYNPEGDPTGETDSGEEEEEADELLVVEEEEEGEEEEQADQKEGATLNEKTERQDDPLADLPQIKPQTILAGGNARRFSSTVEPSAKRRSSAFASTNARRQSKAASTSNQNRRKSVLTLAIESSPAAPINPFNKFTRYNGLVSEGEATKRIRIFFKIFEGSQFGTSAGDEKVVERKLDFTLRLGKNFASGIAFGVDWIEIVVLASARVSDLIGLICWNYTHLQLGPPLKEDPSAYALKIAEENGDVDNDFPALTAGDDIKRYGFPYLALVELETHIVVTVHFEPEQVFSQITLSSLTVTLEEIVEQVRKKRPHLFRALDGGGSSHSHQQQHFPRPLSPTAEEGSARAVQKPKSPTSPTSPGHSPLEFASRIRLALSTEPARPLELTAKIGDFVETPTGSRASSHQAVAFSLKILTREELEASRLGEKRRQQLLDVTDAVAGAHHGKDGEEISTGSFKGSLFKLGHHTSSAATLRANRSSIALYSLDTSSGAIAGANDPATASSSFTSSSMLGKGKLRSRDWSQNMLDQMEAPLYQAFELNAVHKLYNTPVEMGISGTKVEITPRAGYARSPNWSNFADRLRARFNQMKAINMDVEDVVDCEVIPRAKMEVLGRHYFKLVYYNGAGEFKSLKFEGDALTVDDILFKLANVMKMRTSPRRVEYQAYKSRKKSLSTKIYLRSRMMLSSSSSSSSDDLTDDGGVGVGGGGGGNSTAGGAGMSTGAESMLSDPSGPEGGNSWINTLGRQKKEAKFRRFRSRP